MGDLLKRERKAGDAIDLGDRFDRMFDEWARMLPFRRGPLSNAAWAPEGLIKVDEFREDATLVVRAELAGIDPEKDVQITVSDGVLHIAAERRAEEKREEKGYTRQEISYGSFVRNLPLPAGATEASITATYKDGILEIRVPAPEAKEPKSISVSRS